MFYIFQKMKGKGSLQEGGLCSVLWSLVVDELLGKLARSVLRRFGYADDIV